MSDLLEQRLEHYASFHGRVDASRPVKEVAWQVQVLLGAFHVTGMGNGYDVRVIPDGLPQVGEMLLDRKLSGPVSLVSDETVAGFYAERVIHSLEAAGYAVRSIIIPPGELNKTMEQVGLLWAGFLESGLERSSTVVALGGGVVGDLAGFAAATYLRGVKWVGLPTTLLAMVDASLGGKTGADLPQGKNLVGAFHPPVLVLADPQTLTTLPDAEFRSGLAEVIKHAVIADPELFELCSAGWEAAKDNLDEIVRRAIAVKVRIIQEDPYEGGRRAALNLGHTLGHAIEKVSGYRLKHGEAVAIGMVHAARLSRLNGYAQEGLPGVIASTLEGLGLPTEIPGWLDRGSILNVMRFDKKKAGGRLRWVLPVRIGEVVVRVAVEDPLPVELPQ
jgi:3-dehydroquinate synthase